MQNTARFKNKERNGINMRMSDLVSKRIQELLDASENGILKICRNELAEDIGCVPSQINYVLTSRFTPEHGYTIESRRGGGGYIMITRVKLNRSSAIMHLVNAIGSSLDANSSKAIIDNLRRQKIIQLEAAEVMSSAVSENIYRTIPREYRDNFRAAILKQMLLTII